MSSGESTTSAQRACVEAFAHHLVAAVINLDLHPLGDAHLESNAEELVRNLREAAQRGVPMPLRLSFDGVDIRWNSQSLTTASLQARRLLALCSRCEITALAFHPTIEGGELLRFLALLGLDENRDALQRPHSACVLVREGVRHIEVIHGGPDDAAPTEGPGFRMLRGYQDLADCVQSAHVLARHDEDLGIDRAHDAVENTLKLLSIEPSDLFSMAMQDNIDRFTVGHSVRVTLLALQVARAAGATPDELVTVGTAALLHDIGKSKVPQEVLFKQGPLDDAEWREMAQHPRLGAQILLQQDDLDPICIGAAFCHHMKPCGGGYPQPAFPFRPSGVSRLVRICDVFEALTSVRPYKKALTPIEAYAVMFREPEHYDQQWLRFFVDALGLYPQGTRLQLGCGSEAIVVGRGPAPHQPSVCLLTGPGGEDLPADAPDEVTIGVPTDGRIHEILQVLQADRNVVVCDLTDVEILTEEPQHFCR